MCPRHGHVLRSSCSYVKRQRNSSPFHTAVDHWSAHGPFILNVSLSHDGFALLLHLHGSTATDFLQQEFWFAETFIQESQYQTIAHARIVQLLNITHTHTDCVHLHCKQRFTHPSGEGRYITRGVPSWVCGFSFCQRLLGILALASASFASAPGHASTTRPNPFPPSKVRCTTHIKNSSRSVSSFGFVALLSTVQALRSLTNLVLELCLSSRRRSTPFLVHAIHFIVLHQVVFISNLTKNPALHVSDALASVLQDN